MITLTPIDPPLPPTDVDPVVGGGAAWDVERDAPPGKGVCVECGKTLTVTASGALRKHACIDGDVSGSGPIGVAPAGRSRRKPRHKAPARVRNLGVAVIAEVVEWGTDHAVAAALPGVTPDEVPSALPDADAMIGPLIELAWPQIPSGAQKILLDLSEHEELIAALFLWAGWVKELRSFTAERTPRKDDDHVEVHGPAPRGAVPYTDRPPHAVAVQTLPDLGAFID